MMHHPLYQMILIRFKDFLREPGVVFWSVIFPIAMAWVLGVAFSEKAETMQTIALVRDVSENHVQLNDFLAGSKPLYDSLSGKITGYRKELGDKKTGRLVYRIIQVNRDSAILMVKRGQTSIMIMETADSLHYHFDPGTAEARLNYLILSAAIEKEQYVFKNAEIKPLITVGTRYIDYLVPGLIAIGIMNSILWGISYTFIDMRSRKLLRRMIATPMKKSYFLLSHFVSRMCLTIIEAMILLVFSRFYFNLAIQGSLVAFIMMFLAGNLCFMGFAVLISSRTANSNVGNGLINFISMPMTIVSGIFFSYHNFPEAVIPVIKKLPLTILTDNIRSIFIEGTGVKEIMPEFLVLSVSGLLLSFIGLKIFKWY
ncbi:MAG: ABC transporter permease [Bacteroidales bacterium]